MTFSRVAWAILRQSVQLKDHYVRGYHRNEGPKDGVHWKSGFKSGKFAPNLGFRKAYPVAFSRDSFRHAGMPSTA